MDLDGPRSFTVIMRGQTFSITGPQICFAPGNFFEKALLGDFSESKLGVLHLDRSPHTFSIVLDYLSGYDPLPLAEGEWLSSGLDQPKFLRYLQSDAQYYGLDELEKLVSAEIKRLQGISSSDQRNERYKGMPPFDDFMCFKTFEMLEPHLQAICTSTSVPTLPVPYDRNGPRINKNANVNFDFLKGMVEECTGMSNFARLVRQLNSLAVSEAPGR